MSSIATLSQQSQTYPGVLAVDITSVEDGTALHVSQIGFTFGGNAYTAAILSVSGLDISLDSDPIGIMAIPEITLILGDAAGVMSSWDNAHYFKGAMIKLSFVFVNPTTKTPASSDSRVIFQGICNAPDSVSPLTLTLSAYSRFNAEFLLLPTARISIFSQTNFPGDGAQDCDDANSSSPAKSGSSGYAHLHAESAISSGFAVPQHGAQDAFLPYFTCGYGPLRAHSGWGGGNPLGNFVEAEVTATAGLCGASTIGNSSASYPGSNGLAQHIVAITSGTGAGQMRRIASNTTTQITVANPWTTVPDGTSHFAVVFGFCGKDSASCQDRGMYSTDSSSRNTGRFQGITFLPFYTARGTVYPGEKGITINPDTAKFNQPIPLVYGTVVVPLAELFSLTGNFNSQQTRGQYLACLGPIQAASTLIVGGTEVPYEIQSSFDGSVKASGAWTFQAGVIGQNYTDPFFPLSDPHSGMAIVFAKYPPQFLTNVPGQASPLQVQITGLPLWTCDSSGTLSYSAGAASSNPAWIIMDILARSGWKFSELNLPSFYAFSVYANQTINISVSSSQTTPGPRFTFGFMLTQQTPSSEVLRSLLGGCHAILSYDSSGLLRIDQENRLPSTTLGASVSSGTHFVTIGDGAGITIGTPLTVGTGGAIETVTVLNVQLSGGTAFQIQANFANAHSSGDPVTASPAYAFNASSILQDSTGQPDLVRSSLKTAQTPNEYIAQFEDSMRSYVSDSVDVVNVQEANNFGTSVVGSLAGTGFQTVDAATRLIQLALYKAHGRRGAANNILSRGNLFATLTSSIKALDATIGKIVTLTYSKESWSAKPFRVTQVSPTPDPQFPYWKIKFMLREHDDAWYDVINGNVAPPPATVPAPPPPTPPVGSPGGGGGGGTGGGGTCVLEGTEIVPLGTGAMKTLHLENEEWIRIRVEGHDRDLVCTPDHPLISELRGRIRADQVLIGEMLVTDTGAREVEDRRRENFKAVKKAVFMEDGHLFFANGILSHNKPTLMAPIFR